MTYEEIMLKRIDFIEEIVLKLVGSPCATDCGGDFVEMECENTCKSFHDCKKGHEINLILEKLKAHKKEYYIYFD